MQGGCSRTPGGCIPPSSDGSCTPERGTHDTPQEAVLPDHVCGAMHSHSVALHGLIGDRPCIYPLPTLHGLLGAWGGLCAERSTKARAAKCA